MRRVAFVLVFVLLAGVLFYSEPLEAQSIEGEFVVDEFIQSSADSCGSGYGIGGDFVDAEGKELRHCFRTQGFVEGDSYVVNSFLEGGSCSVGEWGGSFKGESGDVVLCVVKNSEGDFVWDVSMGTGCDEGYYESRVGGIVHCRLGGVVGESASEEGEGEGGNEVEEEEGVGKEEVVEKGAVSCGDHEDRDSCNADSSCKTIMIYPRRFILKAAPGAGCEQGEVEKVVVEGEPYFKECVRR